MSTIINQKVRAISEGLKIVRNVLKSNPFPNGFTTSQLFKAAVQQPPPPDFPVYQCPSLPPVIKPNKNRYAKPKPIQPWSPPHPEHPIRSIKYVPFLSVVQYHWTIFCVASFLKSEVLPILVHSSEIKMVRQKRLSPLNDTEKVEKVEKVEKGKKGKKGKKREKGRNPQADFEFVWQAVNRSKPKPKEVQTSEQTPSEG